MEVKVLAPAKINLSLDVLSKRADGYHNISTVMQAVDLYDTIMLRAFISTLTRRFPHRQVLPAEAVTVRLLF